METTILNSQDSRETSKGFWNSRWKVKKFLNFINSLNNHFRIAATKSEDPTHPSEFSRMSEEDRKFLENALKSMTIDVIEELNKAMRTLTDGNGSEEEQVEALEVVTSFVADIDTANGKPQFNS